MCKPETKVSFVEARKRELCREIGYFFGSYFEENGQFCIQHDGKTERYDSVDDLLIAWHRILSGDMNRAWEWHEEIKYIEDEIIAPRMEEINHG